MGKRIGFYKNNFNKGLKELIIENFAAFRQWYLDSDESSIEECTQPFGTNNIKTYLTHNSELPTDFDSLDQQLIDELISEFIGIYCDLTDRDGKLLELFGPTMSVWRYEESNKMVLATRNDAFIRIWNFLIKGRSLKDNLPFSSAAEDFKIGFLNGSEINSLRQKIESYFGDNESMKVKYWTTIERNNLADAMSNSKDGAYTLSGHNPISSGLEYVLSAIHGMNEMNKELITVIE